MPRCGVAYLDSSASKMAASFCRRSFVCYKNSIFKTQFRTGYIVLIPETPEDVADNEIFSKSGIMPDFEKVSAKDCKGLLVRKCQAYDIGSWELGDHIKEQLDKKEKIDIFKNVLGPLELMSVPFHSAWGLTQTLYVANETLMPTKMFTPLEETAKTLKNDKFNMEPIFRACKESLQSEPNTYTDEEKRILQRFVWEGTLNGFDLDDKKKDTLAKIVDIRERRRRSYNEKWINAMMNFKQFIYDTEAIKHFPSDFVRNSALDLDNPHRGPWMLTLKPRVYNRFLEYCDSRQHRLNLWLSKRQVCSRHGDPRFRADMEVEDIRAKKMEYAKLLGFPTYAHMAIKTKMAENIENVQNMLSTLLEKAKIGQEAEVYELEKFANSRDFAGNIEMWDLAFWGRLHKKELYQFDEIAMQEYFPLSQVLLGLFALCEQLFGIVIDEETDDVNAWHEDVRYFHILDEATKNIIGGFYLDPYARKGKRMSDEDCGLFFKLSSASKLCNTAPCGSLIFDFMPPLEDRPSLLLFRQVEDLFGKFGELLQHVLTDAQYAEGSEMRNYEWDAVMVCSKFLRHWLYEPGTLESVSGHYDSGDPLPGHVLHGVCKMRNHMAGTKLCEEIYLSHLDLQLHMEDEFCMPIAEKLWPEHFLFELDDRDHHPFSLKDLISESYGCGYYSRVWSTVVAADAFAAFQEAGFANHEEMSALGKRFRTTFFALGGGCHPSDVFRRFRGRNPQSLPYLSGVGLSDAKRTIGPSTEPTQIAA